VYVVKTNVLLCVETNSVCVSDRRRGGYHHDDQ